jgi:hypothetical protein
MAATVYRYKWASVNGTELARFVPGAISLGTTAPGVFVDVTCDSAVKTDLDDYMSSNGWTYDSTAPSTTPATAASTSSPAKNLASATTTINVDAATAPTTGQVLTATGSSTATWQTPSSGGAPGGSTTEVQFNDGGAFAGDAKFVWDKTAGELVLNAAARIQQTDPTSPTGTDIRVANMNWAKPLLTVFDANGDYPIQTHLGDSGVVAVWPAASAAPTVLGTSLSTTGTVSHPALASTNMLTSARRFRIASSAAAGNVASIRGSSTLVWRGNAANLGGFHFMCHWGLSTNFSGQRCFVGLMGQTTAPGAAADVSALTNLIGFGRDTADTNLQFMYNDNSGSASKIDLGASFARSTTDLLEVFMFCAPNGSTIYYVAENKTAGVSTSGSVNTDLPSSTTFLDFHLWTENNATSSAAQLDCLNFYLETPY